MVISADDLENIAGYEGIMMIDRKKFLLKAINL